MPAASFKELMGQLKEDTKVEVAAPDKKKLADHYKFTEGWYDALLNSDKAIRTNTQGPQIHLDPAEKRQIVEIGVYEGASSCFWSDFYLDNEESSLISIDPFTGSEEHLKNPENYAGLSRLERTARENIAKSKNCGKVEVIKGLSQHVFADWTLVLVASLGLMSFTSTEPTTQSLWQEMLSFTSPWSSQAELFSSMITLIRM